MRWLLVLEAKVAEQRSRRPRRRQAPDAWAYVVDGRAAFTEHVLARADDRVRRLLVSSGNGLRIDATIRSPAERLRLKRAAEVALSALIAAEIRGAASLSAAIQFMRTHHLSLGLAVSPGIEGLIDGADVLRRYRSAGTRDALLEILDEYRRVFGAEENVPDAAGTRIMLEQIERGPGQAPEAIE